MQEITKQILEGRDKQDQAKFEVAVKFLTSKMGEEGTKNLLIGYGDNAFSGAIDMALSLKGQFDALSVCNQRKEYKAIQNDLAGYFKTLCEGYAEDFAPFASGILEDGSATWSKTASILLENKDSITVSIKAINPDYKSDDMQEKRNLAKMIQERLKTDVDNRWSQVSGLVHFVRGTKDTASFSILKEPIEAHGLKWQVSLGYQKANSEPEASE